MAIARMNWGRMKYPLDASEMTEFAESLGRVYKRAEGAPGFLWRIGEAVLATKVDALNLGNRVSATVSA